MAEPFTFSGSEPSGGHVILSGLDQPHADALTWLRVEIGGEGLQAGCSTESLNGDDGLDLNSETPTGRGTSRATNMIRLGHLMLALGSGPLCEGPRRWRTIGGEFGVELIVDRTGHVDVDFRITPVSWQTTWIASVRLRYTMGDLISTGRDLTAWIDEELQDGNSPSAE